MEHKIDDINQEKNYADTMANLERFAVCFILVLQRSLECGLVKIVSIIRKSKILESLELTGNIRLITLKLSRQALI